MHHENSLEARRSGLVARTDILFRAPVQFAGYIRRDFALSMREGSGA